MTLRLIRRGTRRPHSLLLSRSATTLVVVALLLGGVAPAGARSRRIRNTATTAPAADTAQDAPREGRAERRAAQMVLTGGGGGIGDTHEYEDQIGAHVYRVDTGHDLDQYLFADSSPLDFAIDLKKDFGPVDSLGHPAPGNALYGKTGRITLRLFDVDDDNVSTGFVRELDALVVNGTRLPGYLSGADNQWSINSFELPLDLLELPTPTNPNGHNQFQVLIDTGNFGQLVWAVQVDWAELRLVDQVLPVAMIHGITGSGGSMSDMKSYYELNAPELQGRIITPSLTKNGSIAENAGLMAGPIADLLAQSGTYNLNILAHSMGGLNSRYYAWTHPSQVKRLMMVATPNGGSRQADILCGNRNIPWYLRGLVNEALDYFTRSFGDCTGPEDGLYQLQESYVQDVFNKVVLDRHGTRYWTIAGQGNAPGNILLDGEDDGAVSVASVRYLRPDLPADPNPDHPGMHTALYPAYEKNHSGMIKDGSPAQPRSLCTLYPALYPCATASSFRALRRVSAQVAPAQTSVEPSSTASAVIEAGATEQFPVDFEGAPRASVIVLSDHPDTLAVSQGTTAFSDTDVLGEPAKGATLTPPTADPITVENTGAEDTVAIVMVAVETTRRMTVAADPSFVTLGSPVGIDVTLTDADPPDQPIVEIADASGAVVGTPSPAPSGTGEWTSTFTPAAGGVYSVRAWVEGSRARFALDTFSVSSGVATLTGGFSETLLDELGDGLADSLVVRPGITVTQPGDYQLSARLLDSSGRQISTAGATGHLTAGTGTLDLAFDGRDIFRSGASGPYTVADMTLSRAETMEMEDFEAVLGQTATYDYRSFEHFPVEIDPATFSDEGVDFDSDGQFDLLRVTGQVSVDNGGGYAVNGRLVAPDGTELGEFQTVQFLTAGPNALNLTFDGAAIGASGLDGPYSVVDLSVYSTSADDLLGYLVKAHETGPYLSGQFEGGVAPPPPPPEEETFDGLRALLGSLLASGDLVKTAHGSLLAKVDAAEAAYGRGDNRPAGNILGAFLNELEALRGKKKLSQNAYVKLSAAAASLQSRL